MALINVTSVAGVCLLVYLASFVLLAVIRIATGVSIQRVGYFSLRHISYSPREGITIDLRGLGLSLHRPTFAQPTWVSLVLSELKLTLDPTTIDNPPPKPNGFLSRRTSALFEEKKPRSRRTDKRSQLWQKLTHTKEQIKKLHRKIKWLRMVDIRADDSSLEILNVGSVHISGFTAAVHTRRKLLDRTRLFRHKKDPLGDQKPAEWIFTVRSVLLAVGANEPVEVLDGMSINIHGLIYKDKEGLRDTSIALKTGRMYIPVDDLLKFNRKTKSLRNRAREEARAMSKDLTSPLSPASPIEELSLEDVVQELDNPGSREASIVQTVADSKEFFSSILRGVQELQVGMSFIRVSKEIETLRQANLPLMANIVTHEIGIDLHRLQQSSPAHRMYFSKDDIAHQALLAAVSLSVSLDEDDTKSHKLMYIPMATTTIRTTLPSKTMTLANEQDISERNKNMLFANLVITSPSVDLVPQHMIRLMALVPQKSEASSNAVQNRHRLVSKLLPKASIKFSIHEPVVRFVLPVADPKYADPGEFDMIISAISSISFDLESSHSNTGEMLYSLASNFRVVSHQLYYQSASGQKHNLLVTEHLDLKINVSASTEVLVVISGNLKTFSVLMVREEVSKGIYNIVRHFRRNVDPEKLGPKPKAPASTILRRLPPWLLEFHFEGSNCSIETAGTDSTISSQTRGVAFELESWSVDYRSHQTDVVRSPTGKRKASTSVRNDESFSPIHHLSPPTSPSRGSGRSAHPTDGRRLTMHGRNLEGFVIENLDQWEPNPFLSVPRLEVACSTARDLQSPIFHIHSAVKAVYLDFSLYRFYSMGVAGSVIRDAFMGRSPVVQQGSAAVSKLEPEFPPHSRFSSAGQIELTTIDIKASYLRVKASLPADPPLMLQIYNLSSGRHRWSAPFLRSELVRLHVESPHLKAVWARMVTVNNLRVDMRHSKKKTAHGFVEENSVDVSMDFTRLACPHGLRMFLVFDNIVNTIKSIEQLQHRFKTRTNEYILKKDPKPPAKVPRISVRSRAFMFELEDDPFEWKLGLIYHVGRVEQKQRLAREAAYKLKVRKLNEDKFSRANSRHRRSSRSRPPSPGNSAASTPARANSPDPSNKSPRARSTSRGRRGRSATRIRYDRDGTCAVTGTSKISADDAWQKLQQHNARSWKKRIDWMMLLQKNTVKNVRKMFAGADDAPHDEHEHEPILDIPFRPGLLDIIISDLHLVIDKPSFPLAELPKFLHDIGKGMPYSMQYSLLIPMSLALDMGEARVMLRDYPLNLLHIPAIRSGQPPRLPSWSLRSDFVIAEEFRDDQSIRHVKVDIVPRGQQGEDGSEIPGFALDVRRTVSPVKTFSKPVVDINTSLPTTISWGTSYQPVIQDMMMIIENFTKPEIDPSDRVGFWDKVRLSFHSRLTVNWKGDGDVQLRLKGSRDPYVVTGFGAGFVMCWRNDVQWLIHSGNDPRRFMTVRSGEYVLAIPDYSHEARSMPAMRAETDADSLTSSSNQKNAAIFQKVIMKISGNVQWTAGLVFERDLKDGGRSSDFRPHYDVVLKNPKQAPQQDFSDYDAFRDFRSNHIHLSIAVAAPCNQDWKSDEVKSSESYNSVHLTPRFFSHFFDWWSLFSGVMSLPIRQGSLWKGPEKTSKKFGRHLATIKYNLLLSPLFLAHVYKHKDAEDYQEDVVSATGLKIRIDKFMLDLHQRREYFDTLSKARAKQMRTSGMKIYRAELDFVRADLRALSASIAGTTAEDMRKANADMNANQESETNIDMSQFDIPDQDFSWIDMDDFVELDWILPAEANPETKILPLAFTPRFTYFRQTDHEDSISGDHSRTSPFGDEDTHFCVMSTHNDPRRVQMSLIDNRLSDINEKLKQHDRMIGEHELRVVREGDHDSALKEAHESLRQQKTELESKQRFLEHGLRRLSRHYYPGEQTDADHASSQQSPADSMSDTAPNLDEGTHIDIDGLFSASHDEFASDFNNRFIIHNIQFKWNNSLRNTILRYSHQVSQRRGFVYYMSRRAVKFILDIVQEQSKAKQARRKSSGQTVPSVPNVISPTDEKDEESVIQDRIEQLLNDGQRFVDADADPDDVPNTPDNGEGTPEVNEGIAESFQPMNTYHLRLIAPQIQLQSEKNTKSVVLVSAKGMQLKIVAIMDKARMSDDVSGLVQRRFALDMDGAQFFVTSQKRLAKYLHLYSGNRYGSPPGSNWPPWVSLEAMFDFHLDPFGFQRVIQKTSARLQYDKYNPLRLKYNEEVGGSKTEHVKNSYGAESRMDQLWVDFPRIRASCDSAQYYCMYIIVLDLLLYSEPLEKTRSERLEKIMLASDFSDLRGAPEMAERLQERIRQLEELKLHFQVNARYLDKQGWEDRINLEKDLASCEDELFFIMKAINTSQQRNEDRKDSDSNAFLRWYLSASEVVWHLMRDKDEPLLEFQLGRAVYERIDNSDGSNHNAMEIQHIRGWNLLKTALYPEMIGPYYDETARRGGVGEHQKMLQVQWYMLEAIAGIPVLEEFQVTMHPLKVQLERELAKRLFEYIFPGVGSNAFESGNFSPLNVRNMEPLEHEEDSEGEQARIALAPNQDYRPTSNEMRRTSSPGAMGRRLRPTYNLNYNDKPPAPSKEKDKSRGLGIASEAHRFFKRHDAAASQASVTPAPTPVRKSSASSLRSFGKAAGSTTSLANLAGNQQSETPSSSRWHLHRSSSHDRRSSKSTTGGKAKPTDDVSQMLSRANNYMTLAHVKLDSFVICLSYKGKGERNLEDLHDFVFRMPTLEYTNKTWSNLDLALRLKKDVIRALISHTGAIIGNKFSHHRPTKKTQERLREMANHSIILPNSENLRNVDTNYTTSESASLYSFSQDTEDSPRMSFNADRSGAGGVSSSNSHANGVNGTTKNSSSTTAFDGAPPSSSLLRAGSWSIQGGSSVPSSAISTPPNGGSSGVASPIPGGPPGRGRREDSMATIRPSTAGAPSVGKSLLKDTLGRHFSGAGGSGRGRVRFGPLAGGGGTVRGSSVSSAGGGNGGSAGGSPHRQGRERKDSSVAPDEDDGEHEEEKAAASDGDETASSISTKNSVLLLGRKVLGRLS